jgi:hypothetical protein
MCDNNVKSNLRVTCVTITKGVTAWLGGRKDRQRLPITPASRGAKRYKGNEGGCGRGEKKRKEGEVGEGKNNEKEKETA